MAKNKQKIREVYCDHSATTPLDPEILKKMTPYFTKKFGNCSALHSRGQEAHKALDEARNRVAKILECEPEEVIFTSGGTESDNLALKGVLEAYGAGHKRGRRGHLIVSKIEHHAILDTAKYLEKQGFKVTYLPVDDDGLVEPKTLEKAIRKDTLLVSVMYANNEVGTVQPIEKLAQICREKKVLFHTDAVQAPGALPLSVKKLKVDLMSLSGHKFYGPQGVGVLYAKKGTRLQSQNIGGGQEEKRRGSTENLAGIVGFSFALEKAEKNREKETKRLKTLRDKFVKEVLKKIPDTKYNGHKTKRLACNAHLCFAGVEGESILMRLNEQGIEVSTASACASSSLEPSHVLRAMRLPIILAHGSARFTFGKLNSTQDIAYIVPRLAQIIADLRNMSPIYEEGMLAKLLKNKK